MLRHGMTTLVLEKDPVAIRVSFSAKDMTVELGDGRRLLIPLKWYPRLMNAANAERQNWRLLGDGYAIQWPDLDEHIGVEGLLAGHASGESTQSLNQWLAARTKHNKKSRSGQKTKKSRT
jgi:Protein of unknown function (DUF2442)